MKIVIKYFTIFSLLFALFSCQGNTPEAIPSKVMAVTVASTGFSVSPEVNTPTPTLHVETALDVVEADINYLPKMMGNIFVGSIDSGEYIKIDFGKELISRFHLPKFCELLPSHLEAVCKVDHTPGNAGVYIYDVLTEKQDFVEKMGVGRWNISTSGQFLAYTLAEPDGDKILIKAYDFETDEATNIGIFDSKAQRLSIPILSNSRRSMIGVNYGDQSWDTDDKWYVMHVDAMLDKPIMVPKNIAATDSIAWSPDDTLVALGGFYTNDENPHVGTLRCGKEMLLYNAASEIVEFTIRAPEERCFDPFFLHPSNIWSPDGSMLALVLDQQDICIVHVSKHREEECSVISDYYQTENYIARLAWSPDSKFLSFISGINEILLYSIDDNKTFFLVDVDQLSSSPIGNILVWSR